MTLAEILISIAFVALAILAGLGVQLFVLKAQQKSGLSNLSVSVAQSVLAQSRQSLRENFEASATITRTSVPEALDPDGRFEYEVIETEQPAPLTDQLKGLVVTVYWSDQNGQHSYRVATKVAAP